MPNQELSTENILARVGTSAATSTSSISSIDDRHIFAYHSPMTNDDTKNLQPDPLTIGELLTLQQAAEYCGLSKSSLHNYAKQGRLRAKKIGLYWVTTRAAVDDYLQSRHLENIPKKYRK